LLHPDWVQPGMGKGMGQPQLTEYERVNNFRKVMDNLTFEQFGIEE
jgi:hypothetical protein